MLFSSLKNASEMKTFSDEQTLKDSSPAYLFLRKYQGICFRQNENVPRWEVGEAGRKEEQQKGAFMNKSGCNWLCKTIIKIPYKPMSGGR